MQLKNVGVIVVILVPRQNTLTDQREERKEQFLSSFTHSRSLSLSLAHTHKHMHTNTCTHTHTHLCDSFLIVPLMRLKRPFMLCWQCR